MKRFEPLNAFADPAVNQNRIITKTQIDSCVDIYHVYFVETFHFNNWNPFCKAIFGLFFFFPPWPRLLSFPLWLIASIPNVLITPSLAVCLLFSFLFFSPTVWGAFKPDRELCACVCVRVCGPAWGCVILYPLSWRVSATKAHLCSSISFTSL